MLYMVIEKFKDVPEIYCRFAEKGRMMPEGLNYISSWIDTDFKRCFQIMETDDRTLIDVWIANWADIVDFEVISIMNSKEAVEKISPYL